MNLTRFNRILAQTLLLPIVALALVAATLGWQLHRGLRTVDSIQATAESINAATRAEKFLVDEETSLRGYQITADPQFLAPYQQADRPLAEALRQLREALVAQGQNARMVEAIQGAYTTWRVSFAEPLIATTSAGGKTHDVTLNVQGKQQMDAIRARVADVLEAERRIREDEVAHWHRQVHTMLGVLIFLGLGAGSLIGFFTVNRLHRVSEAYQGTLNTLREHALSTFESEERLRTTLKSIGDGVIVCDASGVVELINTAAEQLTGWTQAEAFHKPLPEIFQIINELTRDVVETPVDKVRRLNRAVGTSENTVLISRDGSEIHIDDSGAPMFERTGKLSGIVMVFRDTTEQRRSQNALVATEKLAVAGRLAATIAHEIHNPLDSVVNLLYLLKDEANPATAENYLSLAQQELKRMGQVSRAMLGLYRESKAPVPVDVKEMLDSVILLLDQQIRQQQVSIATDIPDQLEVDGFPAELRQVFTNLIANASDAASPHGYISVTASRSGPSRTNSGIGRPGVVIQIRDNGMGIAPEALEHIFEPFFTTKGEQGTGLGLWVSRGIVDKHGGTIDIRSSTAEDSHGTVITVFLPKTMTTK